ncbi:MAG: N-acetylgalactosamine-6-sulfatase, partial [Bacteroidetes bacterium]|nr:N-acetylgalactosamine-6-sulfatase [Bacteroidota bacterium]
MKKLNLLFLISFTLFSCLTNKTQNQPNIILIMTDDQGWGDLSSSGNTN